MANFSNSKIKLEIIKAIKRRIRKGKVKVSRKKISEISKIYDKKDSKNFIRSSLEILKSNFYNKLIVLILACLFIFFNIGCENKQKILRSVISGRVTDIYGNPIQNAVVSSHRSLFQAKTNKSGFYTLTSLDTGTHRLKVEREGYLAASNSITVVSGLEYYNINFVLQPEPNKISSSVRARTSNSVTIDVVCSELMRCKVAYKGRNLPILFVNGQNYDYEHVFTINNLHPNQIYEFYVEGETKDGRIYRSFQANFKTLHPNDQPGDPLTPKIIDVTQTPQGVKLSWVYPGSDQIAGYRVYKAYNNDSFKIIYDENILFASDTYIIDELASAGVKTRYAIKAVDLDGNTSALSDEVVFFPAGEINGFVSWKKEDSPIHIYGDIIVSKHSVLNIEPGVTVKVHSKDLAVRGVSSEKVEFVIYGILNIGQKEDIVNENSVEKVVFMSSSSLPTKEDWLGIFYKSQADYATSTISNFQIANAAEGLVIASKNIEFNRCDLLYCENGLVVKSISNSLIENLSITNCNYGIICEGNQDLILSKIKLQNSLFGAKLVNNKIYLKNFEIRNISRIGIILEDKGPTIIRGGIVESDDMGILVRGNTIDIQFVTINAKNGILIDSPNKPEIKNCIIVNLWKSNMGIGIEDKFSGRSYPYNNIFGFGIITKNCNQFGGPILNVNPQFIGGIREDYNYRLRDDSPLRSAADNGSELGAYGFIE